MHIGVGELNLIFVILLRLLVPLIIFKKPLLGGFLAILADISDVMLFDYFGTALPGKYYHSFDKIFDLYYLTIELYVALQWKDKLAKKILTYLYAWRLTGVMIFEFLTLIGIKFRPILVLAPNIFEYYFLAYLISLKFNKKFKLTKKTAIIYLIIIGIPKIIHEIIFHLAYQDKTWHFLRDNFLSFIYH
jgi:hypothetical protein